MDLSDKPPEQPRSMLKDARTTLARPPGHPRAVEQARGDDPTGLRWTRDAVDAALAPFVALSEAVPGNRRKAHVPGGGGRRSGELWVDAYSGIKANGLNYVLNCFIEKKGDDPI